MRKALGLIFTIAVLLASGSAMAQHYSAPAWMASTTAATCVSPCTLTYNVLRGTASGAEAATPINSSPILGNSLALAAAAATSGGTTVYTGTITGGASNALAGQFYVVSGFGSAANNGGPWLATASTATTITLQNTAGVAQTGATASGSCFNDTTVVLGNPYYYVVQAVETNGSLVEDSANSAEASVNFPSPPAPATGLNGAPH